jgi:hypothetical protein
MDDLKSELVELKAFIADLKADRASAKEKERREAWTKYVSLTVVVFAVIAAISTQWAGKFSSMGMMSQAQASDSWNFYQALSIKQHMFEMTRTQILRAGNGADTADAQKAFDVKIADYTDRKAKAQAAAKQLESRRETASQIGSKLGLANSCFSVSIAMASLCLLTKKKPLWICSIGFAAFGILEMLMSRTIPVPSIPVLNF